MIQLNEIEESEEGETTDLVNGSIFFSFLVC